MRRTEGTGGDLRIPSSFNIHGLLRLQNKACQGIQALKNIWGTLTPDDRKDDPVYCRDIYGNYYRVTGFGDDKENHRAIIHLEKVTDI